MEANRSSQGRAACARWIMALGLLAMGAKGFGQSLEYILVHIPLPAEMREGCPEVDFVHCPDGGPCDIFVRTIIMEAHAINRHGQVVGMVDVSDCVPRDYAFVYLPDDAYGLEAGTHLLRAPVSSQITLANDINDDGIVVGRVRSGSSQRAMVWDLGQQGPAQLIGSEIHADAREAWAVNNADPYQVAGDGVYGTNGRDVAFRWNSGSQTIEHFVPPSWNDAGAFDLNVAGLIGGWGETPQRGLPNPCMAMGDAVVWTPQGSALAQPGTFRDPRNPLQEISGQVRGVNEQGQLVGRGREHVPEAQPPMPECIDKVLWWMSSSSVGFQLPAPAPTKETLGDALACTGNHVVGQNVADGLAVLWLNHNGTWSYNDLNGLFTAPGSWALDAATDINASGHICGWGDELGPVSFERDAFVLRCTCMGDTNADGVVDVLDIVAVIMNWGCVDPPGPCPGDVTGDGVVDVQDLVCVAALCWGPCDCNPDCAPIPGFQQELAEGGLSQADWDDFVNNHLDDPNYRCWMSYHLVGGTPQCPGPDPWAP